MSWCGLSANLECRSEMYCTRLSLKKHGAKTEKTGCKKSPKIRHLGTIAQIRRAVSSQLRHGSTIAKNLLKSNISSSCPHNIANFGPLTSEISLPVWGTPANFNRFRVLASLLQRHRSPGPTKLCTIFCRLLGWYTIFIWWPTFTLLSLPVCLEC